MEKEYFKRNFLSKEARFILKTDKPINKEINPYKVHRDYSPDNLRSKPSILKRSSKRKSTGSCRERFSLIRNTPSPVEMSRANIVHRSFEKIPEKHSQIRRSSFNLYSVEKRKPYIPYTLQQYRARSDYFTYGGLGPANVGSQKWKEGMERIHRMKQFDDIIRKVNFS